MSFLIEAEWEHLGSGSPEERACFAEIGIRSEKVYLTEAEDTFVNRVRKRVHLSAYHLAEWFAWNWWRLRWEPYSGASDWGLSHSIATVGSGYVWPNISIVSDGQHILIESKPTSPCAEEPLRYLNEYFISVSTREFENTVTRFVEQVLAQLRAEKIENTNLQKIWTDLSSERQDEGTAKRRRFEALLGRDPDEADNDLLERLVHDSEILGELAVHELAATSSGTGKVLEPQALEEIAISDGFELNPVDAVRLSSEVRLLAQERFPAWRRGVEAAKALRGQVGLVDDAISNEKLAELSGVAADAISNNTKYGKDISFALDNAANRGNVVLRSKWETGRRFDLARLLGDRLAAADNGRLYPATRARTYRQKYQRAFAAELLCPFEGLLDYVGNDYSSEMQEEAAAYFQVSPLVARTLLVNNCLIDDDELGRDSYFPPSNEASEALGHIAEP